MTGIYLVGYTLITFVTFLVIWPMLEAASNADNQMEEMLREKKAKDEETLNKLD